MSEMRRWGIFTAIAVVVILAAGWLLLIKPQKSKVADLQTQTQTQQRANALLLTQISALQAEQKELPQQQKELQKFSTQVPNDPAEPTLIRQFSTAAHGAGVDLASISPGSAIEVSASGAGAGTLGAATTPAGTLYKLPLTVTINGSYPNLESFFESIEKLPRSVLNTGFNIGPATTGAAGGSTHELTATLNLAVFYSPAVATSTATQPQALTPATSPTSPTTTATTPAAGSAGGTLPPGTTVPAASN